MSFYHKSHRKIPHSSFYLWVSHNQRKFLDQIKEKEPNKTVDVKLDKIPKLLPKKTVKDVDIDYANNGLAITKSGEVVDKIGLNGQSFIEFEYTNRHTDGFWDIKLDKKELSDKILVEYKSSVEEMSIDDILIQIKKRCKTEKRGKYRDKSLDNFGIFSNKPSNIFDSELNDSNWYEKGNFTIVLASFDERFEKYRKILWNEGIKLIVLDIDDFEEFEENHSIGIITRNKEGK